MKEGSAGATISVVIPAFNAESTLRQCLDSLAAQTVTPHEVILVDDGSEDSTVELAREAGLRVVSLDRRQGPAVARNTGAREASGDVLLFLDSDVVPPEDLIERMDDIFRRSDVVGVQTLYSPLCPASDPVSRYQNFYYHHSLDRLAGSDTATFATWCAAVRREPFLNLGGFNSSIPEPTVEDEELGYALADSGMHIHLARDIQVIHLAAYTAGQFMRRRYRMAKAQAKSGWRSVKDRLLKRYINLRETGTHHSRWVVLSILLTILSVLFLAVSLAGLAAGTSLFPAGAAAAGVLLVLALLCHSGFFKSACETLGCGVLPGFVLLCILDMAVLGWGIVVGTVQFLSGRHY